MNNRKPATSKLPVLAQLCKLIPPHLVAKLAREHVEHYHHERNHQGLGNQLLSEPPPPPDLDTGVRRRRRVGGLLNYYHREAV